MFISHLLATREVEADQSTQTNEGREVEDEEDVLCHDARLKKLKSNYKEYPQNASIISWTIPVDLYSSLQAFQESSVAFRRTPTQNGKPDKEESGYNLITTTEKAEGELLGFCLPAHVLNS